MSGSFGNAIQLLKKHRYALLAGTMLSVFAMPQLSVALDMNSARSHDGTMVVAQGGPPDDPRQKGKQQPQERKGPQNGQPQGQRPGGPPPQHGSSGQPQQGGQPKQFGQPQGGGGQQGGRGPSTHGDNEPKGGAPKQYGRQPGGNPPGGQDQRTGQQGGSGGDSKGGAPKQFSRQPGANPSGGQDSRSSEQGGAGGDSKGGTPKQYGRQPGGNPPGGQDPRNAQQGGSGGEPKGGAPKQFSREPGGNPPGGQDPRNAQQGGSGGDSKGGSPKQFNRQPGGNPSGAQDPRTGQQGGPGGEPKGGAPKQSGQQPSGNQPGGSDQRFQQGGGEPKGDPRSGAPRQYGSQPSGNPPSGGDQRGYQQGGSGGEQRGGPPQQYGNQPGGRPGDREQRQGGPGGDPRGGPPQQYGNQPGGRPGDRDYRQGGGPGGDPRGGPPRQYGGRPDDRRDDGRDFRFGNVDQLRSQRRERREGDRTIIEEPDHRMIVREGNRSYIRHDEGERFRRWGGGEGRVERRGGETYTTISRGGYDIITVTDSNGHLLRRIRRGPDHREVVLIDNRPRGGRGAVVGAAAAGFAAGVILGLAAPAVAIPRDRYIVDADQAPPGLLYDTLEAPPVDRIERPYSLDEVRYNVELRDRMRRVDINNINFDTGSWEVAPDQYNRLDALANAVHRVLERNPQEIFMIEGHTDAVGNDDDNLSLSDRRAEAIAEILTQNFNIPPENLVTQGYGEQYLKVQTDGPSRENRRAVVRRIGPLLTGQNQN